MKNLKGVDKFFTQYANKSNIIIENIQTHNIDYNHLSKLSDNDIKSFMDAEDTHSLSNVGIIGELKRYILQGKEDYTQGKRINEIEHILLSIIYDRWYKQ